MCGRYTVLTEDEIIEIREILKDLSIRIVKDDFENYNETPRELFPTQKAPILIKNENGISLENVRWGFKKWNSKGVIINARSEDMKYKSTFSKLLETGRCVVPAGEFFEWEKLSTNNASNTSITGKKKYYAKDKDGNLLFMAGLYRDTDDEREFVIITKEATGEMAKIHDRLPVILRTHQIEGWLTGEITPEDIAKMEYDLTVTPCDDGDNQEQLKLFKF